MEIRRFRDEFEHVAPLYGFTPSELRERRHDRWIAVDGEQIPAAAETLIRPDQRCFLRLVGDPKSFSPLAHHLVRALRRTIYATANDGSPLAEALIAGGFDIEVTNQQFVVPFDAALRFVRRSMLPARYRLIQAGGTDHDRLFELDNAVRNLVPGTEGWAGNRRWFDDELNDPASYWVAEDRETDRYVGLARMWRNPSGPRFGLIGVLPEHRRRPSPAAALLRTTLQEASTWGHESFTTETAITNRVVFPRLARLGTPTGRTHQLVLRPTA